MISSALRDTVVYSFASIFSKGISFLLLPLYTRVLSPTDYGAFDLIITFGALVGMTVALEITQALGRFYADSDLSHQRRLTSTAFWFSLAAYAIFLMSTLPFSSQLTTAILHEERFVTPFRLGLLFMALNGVLTFLLNQLRWELRSASYTRISVIYGCATLLFSAAFTMGLGLGLQGIMLSQCLAVTLAIVLAFTRLRDKIGLQFDSNALVAMLKFSTPLVPAGVAAFVNLYCNRLALNHFGSLEEVGLFGLAMRVAGMASLLILGIQTGLTPLIYRNYKDPTTPTSLSRLFSLFVGIALFACLAISLFAGDLTALLASPKFSRSAPLIALLAPAVLLAQMYVFAPGIAIAKKTMLQFVVVFAAALVSLVANLALVPPLGGLGAAVATLVSSLTFFGLWMVVSQRFYPIPFDGRRLLRSTATFLLLLAAHFGIQPHLTNPLVSVGTSLLLLALFAMTLLRIGLITTSDVSGSAQKINRLVRHGSTSRS